MKTDRIEIEKECELCTNIGVKNSDYVHDDNGDGIWICLPCEREAEATRERQ